MSSSLENQLALLLQEKDSLNHQLFNTIKQKMVLSQELEAWQVILHDLLIIFKTVWCMSGVRLSTWIFHLVVGGHAASDQWAGASKGGGEKERKTAREGNHGTPEKQVFESERRSGERIFLLFQRQIRGVAADWMDEVSAFIFVIVSLCWWTLYNIMRSAIEMSSDCPRCYM